MVSNQDFQAGAFDMASTEKFCKLLLECAKRRLPVICFISSGGMQTKEGAGALFSMAILNDRITRFIRDNEQTIIVFGFRDCTGGAQASLVTHPLVQTYYFSGTNMPFAGQIVVPSHLPSSSTLSNYLSLVPGAMQGLVKHPIAKNLDKSLRKIDPEIPVPSESVEEVIARILSGGIEAPTNGRPEEEEPLDDLELMTPVKRVLIHARGCAATKLVRKARELQTEIILVQSDADMESVAAKSLRKKDHLVCIGGNTPDESYLNAMSVVRIAEREKADALHPGIGFLSENPDFADLCRRHGINFIGPTVQSMEWMGNKSNATNTARQLKVPVVPGSHGVITDSAAAMRLAEEIGYPVLLKAVHGGGGKGIQTIENPDNFHELFMRISAEAKSAFGNPDVYLEKYVVSMRHVEVQILRDKHGNTKVLGLRDCTVQRNNQKIIEESESTLLPKTLEKAMYQHAVTIADKIGYVGAGTVEFIFDLEKQGIYFMEMNTRLQVEHPVTEAVTGIDIVAEQFLIAGGESIADLKVKPSGYAIELRINAEKAERDHDSGEIEFIPAPGEITRYHFPELPYIELISAVDKGQVVSPYYDSMIVQIICKGKNRLDTIDKLVDYLSRVKLRGVSTNIPLLKRILVDEVFRQGDYNTNFLPEFLKRTNAAKLIREMEKSAGVGSQTVDLQILKIEDSGELKVLSPSAGVFYLTPSPSEPELAQIGDVVSTDKPICLLEAMKLFRPVTLDSFNADNVIVYSPDTQYRIVRINPTNGQAVNQGDLLFVIQPLEEGSM